MNRFPQDVVSQNAEVPFNEEIGFALLGLIGDKCRLAKPSHLRRKWKETMNLHKAVVKIREIVRMASSEQVVRMAFNC
jgi:hypothetical protein